MRKMWREGHRRSPRISALDAKKAHSSRSSVSALTKLSNHLTTNSTTTTLLVKKRRRLFPSVGHASRTRGGKKKRRKLKPLQDVASLVNDAEEDPKSSDEQDGTQASSEDLPINDQPILQVKDSKKYENQVINPGKPPAVQCASWMPEKRILELILDVLQRRDTHEIFAEPVDQEVEDYYEIIKEPMDFGTMRAKLHEGMYSSLEQFEHDVFLISGNAMHFNSSSTIYFRQARAIDELAKKVFHVLKTDPEHFEFEFSGSRRRTNRRPKCEAKNSTYSSSSKLVTNTRSNNGTLNISRTPVPSSVSSVSNLRTALRSMARSSGSGIAAQYDLRDDEIPSGVGDGRGSCSSEADRRSTYTSSLSVLNENSIVSTIYCNSKLLMHINQQENSYRESLMLFVKDLGPTAQMIAKRKLNGQSIEAVSHLNSSSNWHMAPNCKQHVTSSFGQWVPTSMNLKSQKINGHKIELHHADKGERAFSGNKIGICSASMEVVSHSSNRSVFAARSSNDIDTGGVSRSDNFRQDQNSMLQIASSSSISKGRNLNLSVAELNNENNSVLLKPKKGDTDNKLQLLDSASKESQPNVLEHRLNGIYSLSSSSWTLENMVNGKSGIDQTIGFMNNFSTPSMGGYDHQAVAAQGAIHEYGSSNETQWPSKSSQNLTPIPQFMFDLPFLKIRLEQMNSFGQHRYLQQSSGSQGPGPGAFLDRMIEHTHSSLDGQLTNLALQL